MDVSPIALGGSRLGRTHHRIAQEVFCLHSSLYLKRRAHPLHFQGISQIYHWRINVFQKLTYVQQAVTVTYIKAGISQIISGIEHAGTHLFRTEIGTDGFEQGDCSCYIGRRH